MANSKQQNKKLNEQLNSEKDKDDSELQELKRTLNQKRTELTESNSKKTALAKKAKELEETAGNDKKKIEDLQIKYKKSCVSYMDYIVMSLCYAVSLLCAFLEKFGNIFLHKILSFWVVSF